jgi:hypothetical protein
VCVRDKVREREREREREIERARERERERERAVHSKLEDIRSPRTQITRDYEVRVLRMKLRSFARAVNSLDH